MGFPIYLKFQNNKHFFKILSDTVFEEISVIGSKYDYFVFNAEIYPDKVRVQDMINNEQNYWEAIEEKEYERIKANLKN